MSENRVGCYYFLESIHSHLMMNIETYYRAKTLNSDLDFGAQSDGLIKHVVMIVNAELLEAL